MRHECWSLFKFAQRETAFFNCCHPLRLADLLLIAPRLKLQSDMRELQGVQEVEGEGTLMS